MIETYLRPLYQKICVDPLAKRCSRYVTANHITVLSCLTGVAILPIAYFQQTAWVCLLLIISGYLDTLDGTIARKNNLNSDSGAVFDIFSDRVVEAAIIIGLFLVEPATRALWTLGMFAAVFLCITSFLVVAIFTPNDSNKGFHYSPGLIERTEAFIFFLLMFCFPNYFNLLAAVFIGLVLLTAIVRISQFYNETEK